MDNGRDNGREGNAVRDAAKKSPTKAGDYDRRVFTVFETSEHKELVKAAAEASGVSMNVYMTHFATEAARAHQTLKVPDLKAAAASSTARGAMTGASSSRYAKRVFIRFESAEEKELVRAAAHACNMSLSAYAGLSALRAAKGLLRRTRAGTLSRAERLGRVGGPSHRRAARSGPRVLLFAPAPSEVKDTRRRR